ncbi:LOW QUALITY PROTEIN: hypothetical protein NC653_004954 [Populus alba x Populus x berolinensis]|uniref:Uncharacterized protein n=1 Tax=Populus alba x Populus x berolinensis TaxID=444605 RepID=A0AAD6RB48_9ROSI|nr:LOW QUALITY PROTEIN: hypothetical protein NC653_004954 [Populus alba x Populus x berolinensis]
MFIRLGQALKLLKVIRSWLGKKDTSWRIKCHLVVVSIGAVDGCLLWAWCGSLELTTVRCVPGGSIQSQIKWSKMASMSLRSGPREIDSSSNPLKIFDHHARVHVSDVPSMPFSRAQLVPTAYLSEHAKAYCHRDDFLHGKIISSRQSLYALALSLLMLVGKYMILKQIHGQKCQLAWEKVGLHGRQTLGNIKVNDHKEDTWKVVIEIVPVAEFTESRISISASLLIHVLNKRMPIITLQLCRPDLQESMHAHSDSSETCVWKDHSPVKILGLLNFAFKIIRAANFFPLWRVGTCETQVVHKTETLILKVTQSGSLFISTNQEISITQPLLQSLGWLSYCISSFTQHPSIIQVALLVSVVESPFQRYFVVTNHFRAWFSVRDSSMATPTSIELRFRWAMILGQTTTLKQPMWRHLKSIKLSIGQKTRKMALRL